MPHVQEPICRVSGYYADTIKMPDEMDAQQLPVVKWNFVKSLGTSPQNPDSFAERDRRMKIDSAFRGHIRSLTKLSDYERRVCAMTLNLEDRNVFRNAAFSTPWHRARREAAG